MPPLGALTHARSRLVVVLALLLTGCFASDQYPVISIENRADTVIDVFMVEVGESHGTRVIAGVEPGSAYPFSNIAEGCSDIQLVAKDAAGVVIARSPAPLCRPSTWVIER